MSSATTTATAVWTEPTADALTTLRAVIALMRETGAIRVVALGVEVELGDAPAPGPTAVVDVKPWEPVFVAPDCPCGHAAWEHNPAGECLAGACSDELCRSTREPKEEEP